MKELTIEDKRKLQGFMAAGYKIEFYEEKMTTIEGEFDPLVWHHYDSHVVTEPNEKFYYITNRFDDEGELVINETFKSVKEVISYILENIHVFEGVELK